MSKPARRRVVVSLDGVQSAWLDALAELHSTTPQAVLREALRYLAAREHARVLRTRRHEAIRLAARAEHFDPVSDYLSGRPTTPP
jgi:hypothetical protein